MSLVSGYEMITAIVDGDQVSSSLHGTKPLIQYLKKGTSDVSPDWSVAANQPVIYPRAKSQLQMTRIPIVAGTEKWFYNDKEIVFDSTGLSTSPAGLFKKERYDDGGVEVPALRITGNLASTTNTDSDKIGFSGEVELGGIKMETCPDIDIRLEETVGDPYEGFIDATDGGIIDDDTSEITCTGILYKGGAEATSGVTCYWYFHEEDGWKMIEKFNGKKSITVTEADINSELVIRCDFQYGGVKVFSSTRQLSDETDALIISSNPSGPKQLRKGESVTFTPKVISRSTAQEAAGYSFSYTMHDPNLVSIGTSAGRTVTLTHAFVNENSRGIQLFISAKK
ncbi:MAG: hypothetical protein LIP01_11710 [Tannerellaceae bacterium]|nr:hypothetical protein [Tannerellaceae bacterium]